MRKFKNFHRTVRQELHRISILIKGMEFRLMRLRGLLRKRMREELNELKRIKNAILQRLAQFAPGEKITESVIQSIRNDIALMHERCRMLKAQHL